MKIIKKAFWLCALILLAFLMGVYTRLVEFNKSFDLGIYYLISQKKYIYLFDLHNVIVLTCVVFGLLLYFLFITLSKYKIRLISDRYRVVLYVMGKEIDIQKVICCLCIVFSILFCLFCWNKINKITYKYESEKQIYEVREYLRQQKCVVHALGTMEKDGVLYTYTNSLEALNNCYNLNNRVAEVDLMETSDNKVVCAHDGDEEWAYGYSFSKVPDEKTFLQEKFLGIFTPMNTDTLVEFMRENDDFYVVTDIKDNNFYCCEYLSNNYPDVIDRFIIQIYHASEYETVRDLGFKNIIYTVYRSDMEERKPDSINRVIHECDLVGLTVPDVYYMQEGFYEELDKGFNLPIYIHTIDDQNDIANLLDLGLFVYTDNTHNEWFR